MKTARGLARRLAEAEATIAALLSGEIDAVLDPVDQSPVLLSNAQGALLESEARYRRIVETANEGISIVDRDARFTFVNSRFAEMLGYPAGGLVGESLNSILAPETRDAAARRAEHSREGRSEENEVAYLRTDGSEIWTLLKTSPIRDANGEWSGTLGMTTDWTRHRAAEASLLKSTAELVQSEARFRQIAETIREVFFLLDPLMTEIFYVSAAYEQIFGRTCESLRTNPRSWTDAILPADRERVRRETMPEGVLVPFDVEYRIVRPDGTARSIRGRAFAVYNDKGEVYRFAGTAEDITEQRMVESQFRQAHKMEAVGRLAGGVAHDFSNLLTAILGFADMILSELPQDDPMRGDVQEILNAGHSAASLTRQLLTFSRKQILDPQMLDLNALVGGMQTLLRRVIGEDVYLVSTLGEPSNRIHADRSQLEQVIMNLAVNARDAMPAGGTLHIATESVDVGDGFVATHPGAAPGPQVRLTVRDTGTGMVPDVLAHAFEPFFTTKAVGIGTGLGLATVYGIVKQSGGYIWVDSSPGKGTTFTMHFPRAGVDAELPLMEKAPNPRLLGGKETILLVDDQQELRTVVRLILERHGYEVLEAADGSRALALLEDRKGPVHLLLTDVVMPAMNGRELAEHVTTRDPLVRVLYLSGYAADAMARYGIPALSDLIPKPFTPGLLLKQVREVLDRRPPRGTAGAPGVDN